MDSPSILKQTLIHFPKIVADTIEKVISYKAYIPEDIIKQIIKSLDISIEELMMKLLPVAAIYSKVPVSNFKVGAVVLSNSGDIYLGANIEFNGVSLNNSIHAEQSAINNAWLNGEEGIFKIAVTAAPCGHCRQFLNELTSSNVLKIVLKNDITKKTDTFELAQLLPNSFGPANLNINDRLMKFSNQKLKIENENDDLVISALDAANKSYAPYTKNYAGISIKLKNGSIYTGRYSENAAFNPSLAPLQSALAYMNMNSTIGTNYEIADVVLVESNSIISHRKTTESLLSDLTNIELRYFRIDN